MSVKISQLPSATSVTSDDFVPVVDSGSLTTQKATAGQLLDYITGSTFNSLNVTSLTGSTVTGSTALFTTITGSTVTGTLAQFTTISASTAEVSGAIIINGPASLSQYPDYAYILYTASYDKIAVYPGLYVSGNLTASDNASFQAVSGTTAQFAIVSASVISASSYIGLPTSSGGTPGGTNQTVQFNSGSTFSGSSNLIYNYTTNVLSGTTAQFTTLSASTISASNYLGLPSFSSSIELPKLIVSSSVSLLTTQRAVFAKNSISSSISITLPSASLADSREYYIIKADSVSGSVSVLPSSPNLINGISSFDLNGPYQSITLIHDGTDWYVF